MATNSSSHVASKAFYQFLKRTHMAQGVQLRVIVASL
jgi:hypothetical protein